MERAVLFKFVRNTTETYYNCYELRVDEHFCQEMTDNFNYWNMAIIKPLTPDLIHSYLTEDKDYDEVEQNFVSNIKEYLNDAVYNGDMWTYDSDIVAHHDNIEEI